MTSSSVKYVCCRIFIPDSIGIKSIKIDQEMPEKTLKNKKNIKNIIGCFLLKTVKKPVKRSGNRPN